MKIAYAGFDLFYPALKLLNDNGNEIIKIFSCKVDNVYEFNTKVTELAHNLSVPITYDKITLDDLAELKYNGCEALICAGYYYRMPIDDSLPMVNIHPSLLPVGRGAWPMPVTILNGIKTSGVTFHKMEESFDTGDILMQKSFELSDNEDLDTFMDKVYSLLPPMIKELTDNFGYYYDNATKQSEGEYWDCPDEYDYIITKYTPFDTASLILRAFMGFDCIYDDGNTRYALLRGKAVKGQNHDQMFKIQGGYIDAVSYHKANKST